MQVPGATNMLQPFIALLRCPRPAAVARRLGIRRRVTARLRPCRLHAQRYSMVAGDHVPSTASPCVGGWWRR